MVSTGTGTKNHTELAWVKGEYGWQEDRLEIISGEETSGREEHSRRGKQLVISEGVGKLGRLV